MKDLDKELEKATTLIEKIRILREYTNCSVSNAVDAMRYKNTHPKITACGYLRAIIGDTSQFSNKQFYKRVEKFSDLDNDIL